MSAAGEFPRRILLIDDQFGRRELGKEFRKSVGEEVFSLYEADQRNLLRNFGLRRAGEEGSGGGVLAEVTICPSQRWDAAAGRIENVPEQAVAFARERWPAKDGSRWALVLLDLRFTFGALNAFGDPEEASLLGAEVLLPLLRRELGEELPIVVLSSADREELNAKVRELGALDFLQRVPGAGAPPDESRRLLGEALFLHGLYADPSGRVVGGSLALLKTLRQLRRASRSARTVLLQGETGTGKGVLARYLHGISERSEGPFEVFNAAGRNAELQADELFGHWKGAFTDAQGDAPGIWERADGGTLFIDEVADLTPDVQMRLMQPIEERRVRRLGTPPRGEVGDREVDVRVVLATNRPLDGVRAIKRDFLNRVDAFVVEVPPLRDRREDIPGLASSLAASLQPGWRGRFLPKTVETLVSHGWRAGNVRELRNVVERALTNNPGQDVTVRDLGLRVDSAADRPSEPTRREESGAESRLPWQRLVEALGRDPDDLTAREVRTLREGAAGGVQELLGEVAAFALRLTSEKAGRPNLSAAARFLLGREDVTPLEARQFFRRILSVDKRSPGGVAGLSGRFDSEVLAILQRVLDGVSGSAGAGQGRRK